MEISTSFRTDPALQSGLQAVARQIGRTSFHEVKGLFSKPRVSIFAKKEWEQLSGSIKARAAYQIMQSAIQTGALHRGKILLDATSGNTGIAYAAIGKALGIRVALCLPENASSERKATLKALGAAIIFTSPLEGTDGAREVALEMVARYPERYFHADQYGNDNNWKAHYQHTAPEIIQAFPQITHFVAGLGTTGTFTGVGRKLKTYQPGIQLTALQPDSALHGMEGWKHIETATVPGIYDHRLSDRIQEIDTALAYETIRAAWKHEGLRLSPSAAANLAGAIQVAEKLDSGTVVTVFADNADRYGELMRRIF